MTDTPAFGSAREAYDALSRGFYVESEENGDPFPMVSDYHREGVIVIVHSSRARADELAAQLSDAYEQKGKVKAISSLWDTVTQLARRGIAGLMLDGYHPIFFMNRLSDMNRALPTVGRLGLRQSQEAIGPTLLEDFLYFGVRGPTKVEESSLVPWHNFRALDAMSVRWMLHERPLPESLLPYTILSGSQITDEDPADVSNRLVLFHDGATLLGPYVSDMGAVPVFSAHEWADFFGLCHGILEDRGEGCVPTGDIDVQPIKGNFTDFLDAIYAQHSVFVDIGLNPTCHRFRQGYFFNRDGDWFLRSLAGVFRLAEGRFERRDDVVPLKNDDDVGGRNGDYEIVEGMTTLVQHPFKRLLGATQSAVPDAEAQQIIDEELESEPTEGYEQPEVSEVSSDSFVVDAFDKISGDRLSFLMTGGEWEGPLVFADIVQASCWLLNNFLDFDEEIRTTGTKTCHGPFHPGSNDPEAEAATSSAFRRAVRACLIDALRGGYRPEHSWHLQRLFQDVSAVLEITEAGYVADLLACDEDLLTGHEDDGSPLLIRLKAIKARLDPKTILDPSMLSDLRQHLGQAMELLSSSSVQILCAAMEEMKRIGKKPSYDYAGVSMKLCKTFERELKQQLFDSWCREVRSKIGKKGVKQLRVDSEPWQDDRTGNAALDFLAKRQKVELGAMRYMLRAVADGSDHPAIKTLDDFLDSFAGRDWLLSEEHDEALASVSSRYRNGGVHEHLVDFELCSEAMDYVICAKEAVLPTLLKSMVKK